MHLDFFKSNNRVEGAAEREEFIVYGDRTKIIKEGMLFVLRSMAFSKFRIPVCVKGIYSNQKDAFCPLMKQEIEKIKAVTEEIGGRTLGKCGPVLFLKHFISILSPFDLFACNFHSQTFFFYSYFMRFGAFAQCVSQGVRFTDILGPCPQIEATLVESGGIRSREPDENTS